MPMLGVMSDTFEDEEASMRGVEDFFSVARTMPLAALMPSEVTPWLTALRAYSVEHVREYRGSLDPCNHTNLYQLTAVDYVSAAVLVLLGIQTYLGEKVVSEKEYLSAMLGLLLPARWFRGRSRFAVCCSGATVRLSSLVKW